VIAILLGFLGSIHPFFDLFSIPRVHLIRLALAFLAILFFELQKSLLVALSLAILISSYLREKPTDESESGSVSIYTKNLLHNTTDNSDLISDITDLSPDIVVFQEVSRRNRQALEVLGSVYLYQALCPWGGWNGIAILSKAKIQESSTRCSKKRSLMAVKIEEASRAFWVVGVHLQQPWPDVQFAHLSEALPILEGFDAGVIVAGDFNSVPWSFTAKKIGEITATNAVGPFFGTYGWGPISIPIDQVWGRGGYASRRPRFGSDHFGVFATTSPSRFE